MTKEMKVLKRTEYSGVMIYVMNYGNMFQYLFPYDGEIIQDHMFLKPKSIWGRIIGLFGSPVYTEEEMDFAIEVMLSGAMRSIETIQWMRSEELKDVPAGR